MIGGATAAEANTISGNAKCGLALSSDHNFAIGNAIGADVGGGAALGNAWVAVNVQDAEHNVIQGNVIAHNGSHGFWVHLAAFNTIRRNSIHDNAEQAILLSDGGNDMLPAPVILTAVSLDGVSGTACPDCTVEVFSDDEDEGRIYEGTTVADAAGRFTFTKASGLTGPFITATATDGEGNTSAFSSPRAVGHNVYLPAILRVW
jgi:titin